MARRRGHIHKLFSVGFPAVGQPHHSQCTVGVGLSKPGHWRKLGLPAQERQNSPELVVCPQQGGDGLASSSPWAAWRGWVAWRLLLPPRLGRQNQEQGRGRPKGREFCLQPPSGHTHPARWCRLKVWHRVPKTLQGFTPSLRSPWLCSQDHSVCSGSPSRGPHSSLCPFCSRRGSLGLSLLGSPSEHWMAMKPSVHHHQLGRHSQGRHGCVLRFGCGEEAVVG